MMGEGDSHAGEARGPSLRASAGEGGHGAKTMGIKG